MGEPNRSCLYRTPGPVGAQRTRAVYRRRLAASCLAIGALLTAAAVRYVIFPASQAPRVEHFSVQSRFVHRRLSIALVSPHGGGAGRPLLVFLHGRGGDQDSELSSQLLSALTALGRRAPDIVFPAGGDHSYWHDRGDGAWSQYVTQEVIPAALARLHADPHRLAIGGISMGGFGAYDIARLAPGKFCAVGGHSAALWNTGVDSAPGAFDNAVDFARHDVISLARLNSRVYGRARLWLDGGDRDPFRAADENLSQALHVRMHVAPGGHDNNYWNAHWADYLSFYAYALASCR